jgi:hypothetical protein
MRSPGIDLTAVIWRRSSYSNVNGGDCVEVGTWRRSSYSNQNGGSCVEVADGVPGVVPVRDSKNPGPALVVPADAWAAFVERVKG